MNLRHVPFFLCAALCLLPFIQSPVALIGGLLIAAFNGVPTQLDLAKISKKLLALSIIGLGFGIQLEQAIASTTNSLGLIIVSLLATISIGALLGKFFDVDQKTSHLISCGTAICGGSAIAAVGPAIDAKNHQMSVALATIFGLNALALFIFPIIGHALSLDQQTFGLWSAIAIHDTSSVVGAAGAYGEEALQVATTTKLARALWIIPVAFISGLVFKSENKRASFPMFTIWYVIAIMFSNALPQFADLYSVIFAGAKQCLVLSLYLVGATMTIEKFKQAGFKPLLQAVTLWVSISTASLLYILA